MSKFIQIDNYAVNDAANANNVLREWQLKYPKRKIVNISMGLTLHGYLMTIVYEMEV